MGPGRFFRTLNILYLGMFFGSVLFFFTAFFFVRLESEPALKLQPELRRLTAISGGIAVGIIAMIATLLYQRFIATGQKQTNLLRKRQRYQMATILYASMLNGAGLFTLVVYWMTASNWYLGFYAVVLGLYLLRRPSKAGFARDMALSRDQLQRLEDY